jgi:RimJ/RimL family protein N-acetyltransferase
VLRRWRDEDREPFATMNADPRVMEFLPAPLDRTASDSMIERISAHFAEHGFGLWAIEVPGEAAFVGYVGLLRPTFESHFTPCVEVGWRLAAGFWGRGIATEAARAAIEFGFEKLGLDEIVSFTVPANARSIRVMEKLGMTRSPDDDFDHPRMAEGHPLRRHVLYRLTRERLVESSSRARRSTPPRGSAVS